MNIARRIAAAASLALVAALAGCSFSFSTAHITDFAIAKDEAAKQPASAFAPAEPVYANVVVANVPGKVTLKWRLSAEDVAGFAAHTPLPEADTNFELNGDGNSTYTLKPPKDGWPAGIYGVSVSLVDDSGAEKDKRSGTFRVAGAANAPNAGAAPAAAATPASHPEFSEIEFADSADGDAADSFATGTAKIYARTDFKGVPNGATVSATWVAEKARGVAPETKIVSSDVVISDDKNVVDFSITRPDKGWPPGSYRVDIAVDGKPAISGQFEIDK